MSMTWVCHCCRVRVAYQGSIGRTTCFLGSVKQHIAAVQADQHPASAERCPGAKPKQGAWVGADDGGVNASHRVQGLHHRLDKSSCRKLRCVG